MTDYAWIATQYAREVVDGSVLACKWVRLACARHLRDLERDAGGWRYTWNPVLRMPDVTDEHGVLERGKEYRPADRICMFAELFPHVSGEWAMRGEQIRLVPWQVFILASIFGWVDRETLRRRFRIADLVVARKNAKSTLGALIGLYMLAADGEYGAEVYSGATSEKQARKVFGPALEMTRKSPEFRRRFGVVPMASQITVAATNSKFSPLIGKPGDGDSPSCAIVDEYHEHASEELYETMRTGQGARSQPLMLVITTAGNDISGPCYDHQQELQQILEGLVEDEKRFGVIYTIDPKEIADPDDPDAAGASGDDWTSEEALYKANPNLGVSVDLEFLLDQQRDAIRDPDKQATFQTKHLDMWVASASPWLNLHRWKSLADKSLALAQFRGESCWVGLDLANTTDLASRCLWFQRMLDGVEHHYVFWRHYLPQATIDEEANKHYQGWRAGGWLIETPGSMIDQKRIEDDLDSDAETVLVREIAIDLWGAPGIAAGLQAKGYAVVTIPQRSQYFSPAMKWIYGLVKAGRLHHVGDPIATWCVANVEVKPGHNDSWFPRRGKRERKIDAAVAMLDAAVRAMLNEAPKRSVYEERGVIAV